MKTEQEQIKAIKQIIDERVETTLGYVQGRHGNVIKTVDTIIIARDIVEAGYGDVSEYKAEIERLKEENGQSRKLGILGNNATVEFLDDAVSEPSVDCKDIENYAKQFRNRIISINEKEIKQAKIDVLNRVMTYINNKIENDYGDMSDSVNYLTINIYDFDDFIDELIKEVE